MGLSLLLGVLLYFAILVGVPAAIYRFGKSLQWSVRRCRFAAFAAFMVIFLPVFWDWLPTVWLHSYYCERYAGLSIDEKYADATVMKTLQRWVQAHPGVVETLVREKPVQRRGSPDQYYYQLNQRFRWEIAYAERALFLRQDQEAIVDTQTGEIIARFVDFSTGQQGGSPRGFRDYKVWMNRMSCEPEAQPNRRKFNELRLGFEMLGA